MALLTIDDQPDFLDSGSCAGSWNNRSSPIIASLLTAFRAAPRQIASEIKPVTDFGRSLREVAGEAHMVCFSKIPTSPAQSVNW